MSDQFRRLRQVALLALLAAAMPTIAIAQPPIRASFDCSKARTQVERTICSSWDLGYADRVLALLYQTLYGLLPEMNRDALVKDQRAWLRQRDRDYLARRKKLLALEGKKRAHNFGYQLMHALLDLINQRNAILVNRMAQLPVEMLHHDPRLPKRYPTDHRRLFGNWKLIAFFNDGVHDSGFPDVAEQKLGTVVNIDERSCPGTTAKTVVEDVYRYFDFEVRGSPEEYGFGGFESAMSVTCVVPDDRHPEYHHYLFFNDYMISEALIVYLRVADEATKNR